MQLIAAEELHHAEHECNGEALTARLTRYSAERLRLAPGVPVFALIKTVALSGPARGGRNAETGDA